MLTRKHTTFGRPRARQSLHPSLQGRGLRWNAARIAGSPKPNGFVRARRGEELAIGRKTNPLYISGMAVNRQGDALRNIPESDRLIGACRTQQFSVRRKLGTAHVVAVLKGSAGAIEEIPKARGVVATSRGKKLPVW